VSLVVFFFFYFFLNCSPFIVDCRTWAPTIVLYLGVGTTVSPNPPHPCDLWPHGQLPANLGPANPILTLQFEIVSRKVIGCLPKVSPSYFWGFLSVVGPSVYEVLPFSFIHCGRGKPPHRRRSHFFPISRRLIFLNATT